LVVRYVSGPDYKVGVAFTYWFHQTRNVGRRILVVGICVDNHISSELQGCVETSLKGNRQSFVVAQLHHHINPVCLGDCGCFVT
tara:strand:+ start:1483 stop:1734 length:252 start_codon:yes stop_codon:yes gene_type:complete